MAAWWIALCAAVAAQPAYVPVHVNNADKFQRGVGLGLFAADPAYDYTAFLDEIVSQGATDVAITVVWSQETIRDTAIAPRPGVAPSQENLLNTLVAARARGLRVMLLPILRIHTRAKGEWRGKISFDDSVAARAWWASYRNFILAMAQVAARSGVERLSVGSELLALEGDRVRWVELVAQVRRVFAGKLLYSANWDHVDGVTFWDAVDEAGMTAYFELGSASSTASVAGLVTAWQRWLPGLRTFAARVGKPVVITEVGYPSLQGAHRAPWDETRKAAVDVDEQRACYQAFVTVAEQERWLQGVYFWNWFGGGGPQDGDYTPRGKPAALELRRYFQDGRSSHAQ
jgi:hypothetical protein